MSDVGNTNRLMRSKCDGRFSAGAVRRALRALSERASSLSPRGNRRTVSAFYWGLPEHCRLPGGGFKEVYRD